MATLPKDGKDALEKFFDLPHDALKEGKKPVYTAIRKRLPDVYWKMLEAGHNQEEAHIPLAWAKAICGMESICFNEGIGPHCPEMLRWIANTYPELKEEYPLELTELESYSRPVS